MSKIREFILNYIQMEYSLPVEADIDTFNYVENGYVDSIGIIRFVVALEEEFGFEFTDMELSDPAFRVIGTLAKMVEQKMEGKQ